MKFEILESEVDVHIKNDLYKFLEGIYIGNFFTKEENDYALKLSFFFNHATIERNESKLYFGEDDSLVTEVTYDKLVFTYGGDVLKISIDNSFLTRETYFKYMMDEDFFQNSLKSFIRENRINKIIE